MALFEACCKEKIQQFEDAGSDEEDIWDEKDVTFAPDAQRRPRYCNHWNMLLKCFSLCCWGFFAKHPRHSSYTEAQEVQTVKRVRTLRRRMGSETRSSLLTPHLTTGWKWTRGMVRIEFLSCHMYHQLAFS